jgi:hypothetical protein
MILHIVRCDRDDCDYEEDLILTQERTLNRASSYTKPKSWLQYDGKDFNSHACVSAYAAQKQRELDLANKGSVA